MNPEKPSELSPEDKSIKREVFTDMKETGRGEAPKPQQDWDLVWVISGPDMDIAEDFQGNKEVLFNKDDKSAEKDAERKVNESRERFETGIKVAKEVTALRLGKRVEELTMDDLINNSPDVYWNGGDWQNANLRQRIKEGFLDRYNFPSEKVIVSPDFGIQNTGDNFDKIEDSVIENRRKIAIVSDTYHLPRVRRLLCKEGCKISEEDSILYPSEPRRVPVGKALGEIKKIPGYTHKGILGNPNK